MNTQELIMPDNMEEFWTIPDYDGRKFSRYLINWTNGRVWSCINGRYLVASESDKGYKRLSIVDDNKIPFYTYEYRLCLSAKLQSWQWHFDGLTAHHIDTNPANNAASNLEPRSRVEQIDDAAKRKMSIAKSGSKSYQAKLNEEQVYKIKSDALGLDNKADYIKHVADQYKINKMTIRLILWGKTWKHVAV